MYAEDEVATAAVDVKEAIKGWRKAAAIAAPEDDMTEGVSALDPHVEGMDEGREERNGDTLDGGWYATVFSEPILEDNQEGAKAPQLYRSNAKQTSHSENAFQTVFDVSGNLFDETPGSSIASASGERVPPSAPRTASAVEKITQDSRADKALPLVPSVRASTGKMQETRGKTKLGLESSRAWNEKLDRLNELAAPLGTKKRRAAKEDNFFAFKLGKARDGREVTRSETKSLERGPGSGRVVDEKPGDPVALSPMNPDAERHAKYRGDGNTIPVKPHAVTGEKRAIPIAGEVAQGSFGRGGGGGLRSADEEIPSLDHRMGLAFGGKDLASAAAPADDVASRGRAEHSEKGEEALLAQTSDQRAGEGPSRQKGVAHAWKPGKTPVGGIILAERKSASRVSGLRNTREDTTSLSGNAASTPSPRPTTPSGQAAGFGDYLPVPEPVDAPALNGTRWNYAYEREKDELPGAEGKEAVIGGIADSAIPGQDRDERAKGRSTKREGQNKATFTVPSSSSPDYVDQGKRVTVVTEFFRLEGETLGDRENLKHEGFKNLAKPDPFSTKQPAPAKTRDPPRGTETVRRQ
jgi:hypothetical protein